MDRALFLSLLIPIFGLSAGAAPEVAKPDLAWKKIDYNAVPAISNRSDMKFEYQNQTPNLAKTLAALDWPEGLNCFDFLTSDQKKVATKGGARCYKGDFPNSDSCMATFVETGQSGLSSSRAPLTLRRKASWKLYGTGVGDDFDLRFRIEHEGQVLGYCRVLCTRAGAASLTAKEISETLAKIGLPGLKIDARSPGSGARTSSEPAKPSSR